MRGWRLAYLGRRTFPAELTDFELRQAFTFDLEERTEIRRAFRSRLRIGVALQLGFLRLTGTSLRTIEYVPPMVLRHLAAQFSVAAPDLATLRESFHGLAARGNRRSRSRQNDKVLHAQGSPCGAIRQ
jgi:hypothetical protein